MRRHLAPNRIKFVRVRARRGGKGFKIVKVNDDCQAVFHRVRGQEINFGENGARQGEGRPGSRIEMPAHRDADVIETLVSDRREILLRINESSPGIGRRLEVVPQIDTSHEMERSLMRRGGRSA